jgi:lipopolysaccharide/colanic/teichoic acid biosynthesis glycosyltransferase
MKRFSDIVGALLALSFTWPFLMFAVIGIRLSSAGPVLFRAQRVGRGGAIFEMLKFRTMHVNVSGAVITAKQDPRIFGFGAFLRKTKIDELPQLWNVLIGDLALVGPRPEDPLIVKQHYVDWMKETLAVLPGVTSPGSIYYYLMCEDLIDPLNPEASYIQQILPAKLAIERAYIDRANVWTDLFVIAKTCLAIVGRGLGYKFAPSKMDMLAVEKWANPTLGLEKNHAIQDVLRRPS